VLVVTRADEMLRRPDLIAWAAAKNAESAARRRAYREAVTREEIARGAVPQQPATPGVE
jgi:hypothetical protein